MLKRSAPRSSRVFGSARETNQLTSGTVVAEAGGAPVASGPASRAEPTSGSPASPGGGEHTFIERLYRSTNSYADSLSPEELESVNVDLGLENYLVEQARAGRQVIVTGNPGDGKTHLIERIRKRLEAIGRLGHHRRERLQGRGDHGAWRACREDGQPFVLAINEWPLLCSAGSPPGSRTSPLAEALRQVQEAARYYPGGAGASAAAGRARPTSSTSVCATCSPGPRSLNAVVDRLTHDRFY